MVKIYLAGPDVFLPNAIERGNYMKNFCRKNGFEPLFPFDNDNEASTAKTIFENNLYMLHQCDVVLANISPFHGPSADVGTVWEMGYASGLGKTVVTYSNDLRDLQTRIIEFNGPLINGKTKDGMGFDDFGEIDNLMLVKGLGTEVFPSFEDAIGYLNTIFDYQKNKSSVYKEIDDLPNFVVPSHPGDLS
jgi:nucleoside 2-deoxyribosyltransferase